MSGTCIISFTQEEHPPVEVEKGCNPSEILNSSNSPVLFGCRTGVCGTCLVEIVSGAESIEPASAAEKEMLEVMAPGNEKARFACQLSVEDNMEFNYIGK